MKVDVAQAREIYVEGYRQLRAWLDTVGDDPPGDGWTAPSVLPRWTVGDLVAHWAVVADSVAALTLVERGAKPLSIADYVASYADGAARIDAKTRAEAGGQDRTSASLRNTIDDRGEAALATLATLNQLGSDAPVVRARRGPIRLGDFLVTRIIELVVHADDLARTLADSWERSARPSPAVPSPDGAAERLAVRALLDVLAERAPGRSVEVRVPPHAAMQCVEGPRHTRGTPPGVVELGPRTWLRVATGRVTWDDAIAAGDVHTSGERTELSPYLPLL